MRESLSLLGIGLQDTGKQNPKLLAVILIKILNIGVPALVLTAAARVTAGLWVPSLAQRSELKS